MSDPHQPAAVRGRRPETTYSKHVRLTEFGRQKIDAWASANNINFSAAIETLALLGLADERSSFIVPALRATTLQGIRLSFNRLARLLSDIAIETAVARTMSEGIMLPAMVKLARNQILIEARLEYLDCRLAGIAVTGAARDRVIAPQDARPALRAIRPDPLPVRPDPCTIPPHGRVRIAGLGARGGR